MAFNIAPYAAIGGTRGAQSLSTLLSVERSPHMKWVERLRTAIDFISPDNSLFCIADSAFSTGTSNVTPIGLAQSFSWSESLPSMLVGEIGSRRKRAVVGSSQGGQLQLSKMVVMGESPLKALSKGGTPLGIDSNYWTEQEWLAMVGMNHDTLRTPLGMVVVEASPDGRNYSAFMFEQCLVQGQSRMYQAGQHLIVDNFALIYEMVVPLWSINSGDTVDYTLGL